MVAHSKLKNLALSNILPLQPFATLLMLSASVRLAHEQYINVYLSLQEAVGLLLIGYRPFPLARKRSFWFLHAENLIFNAVRSRSNVRIISPSRLGPFNGLVVNLSICRTISPLSQRSILGKVRE